ncbi:hypothetical protein I2W78_21505 [Streptomyces spinoverrucosus]|uniref:hypothetical protein n=1 Tax=Streptomyces spinoverrucosus TaxID=284043 RepID=UPI0018C36B38|nr:hypothetical protein [Streptomyces spinoverrucosus]MBG0854342.1 hypothetical protein [Streptomyces spinoverrucosus]
MNEPLTLDGLAVPLRALRLLVADFGHLPAPDVDLSRIYPDRLTLRFHEGLDAFEAWREALAVPPEKVTHGVQGDGMTRVLKASTDYAGAVVHLHGYTDVPAADGGAA